MLVFVWWCASAALAAPGAEPAPLSAEEVVAEARAANPELRAARLAADATGAMVWGAASPGEAMVEVGRERAAAMSASTLALRAELPFPGTTLLAGRAAAEMAHAARARARGRELDVVARARGAHARLWKADTTLEALGAAKGLMDQTAAIAQARVAGGRAGSEELLLAQAEAARMGVMLAMERGERDAADAELAALLHRPDRPVGAVAPPTLSDPALEAGPLQARARTAGPDAAMAEHDARAARARAGAAALNVLPRLAPFYSVKRFEDGSRETMAGLGLAYPIFFWAPAADAVAARREAGAARAAAAAAADEAGRMAAEEVAATRSHLFAAREYRDVVLPLLAQAVRAARASYESGRGDILKLLAAARDELSARQAYATEVWQFTLHRARLESAVGGALEEAP